MRVHATRRAIPVEQSIHWKPLHDSHYVIASLQPGDGGRRKIFRPRPAAAACRSARRRQATADASSVSSSGSNAPARRREPIYFVIESLVEQPPAVDDEGIAAGLASALGTHRSDRRKQVLGWYSGAVQVTTQPSPNTAFIHTSYFREPWQTVLVTGEGLARVGAFFLDDTVNTRCVLHTVLRARGPDTGSRSAEGDSRSLAAIHDGRCE
jgi:hypothetical protein